MNLSSGPRVALIGPSHWHFPLYRNGLLRANAQIVGISDPSPSVAAKLSAEFGCGAWSDVAVMLDECRPEFVFAFGVHAHQPLIARQLIERGIPHSIEKPCGIREEDVRGVRIAAEAINLFVSIPFHYRISPMVAALSSLTDSPSADYSQFGMRVNAGSPLRHSGDSPWLVVPELAGGGCLMNLGHHPIDTLHQLTGAKAIEVFARTSNKCLGLQVEDHAVVHVKLDDGTQSVIETGYTHPARPDSYMDVALSVTHRRFNAHRDGSELHVHQREKGYLNRLAVDWDFKRLFADYAAETLHRASSNELPIAGLRDLEAVMRVVDAAYRSAACGQAIKLE